MVFGEFQKIECTFKKPRSADPVAGKLPWQGVSYLWIVGSAWHDFLWMGKGLDRGQSDYTFGDKIEQVSSIFRTKQQVDILVTKKRQFGNS